MNPPATDIFTEADLDRLESLLDSELFQGEAMLLDELQALLCAIISGPEPVSPDIWLPIVFGDEPAFENESQAAEVIGLLMRFYNDLVEKLSTGEGWEIILYPVDDDPEELDFATWADAYIYGSQLGSNWYEAVGDHAEQLTELLQPLFLLNGMLREDTLQRGEAWMSATQEKAAIESAQSELPDLIGAIHDFWRAKQASDASIAEELQRKGKASSFDSSPSVGRDDLCPCRSGKPFKKCCGSPEKLH
jgi:uncharacterized protein